MRWSYKTVRYELKKDGLLGSAFLDEAEMEQSLNEYGKSGWELVSVLETLDGVIAIFKQALGGDLKRHVAPAPAVAAVSLVAEEALTPVVSVVEDEIQEDSEDVALLEEYEDFDEQEDTEDLESPDTDIGSIRIE